MLQRARLPNPTRSTWPGVMSPSDVILFLMNLIVNSKSHTTCDVMYVTIKPRSHDASFSCMFGLKEHQIKLNKVILQTKIKRAIIATTINVLKNSEIE